MGAGGRPPAPRSASVLRSDDRACPPRCPTATRARRTGAPDAALGGAGAPFGFYVHVPFCAVRCGYCDFNTYTADELGGAGARRLAGDVRRGGHRRDPPGPHGCSGDADVPVVDGVLRRRHADAAAAGRPGAVLARDRRRSSGWPPDAEVTTEANPDSVDAVRTSRSCATAGFTRVSFGMQSAVPHVLAHPRPHPRPAAGAGGGRLGARGRASTRSAST